MKRLISADWQLSDGNRDRYRIDFVRQRLPKIIQKYKPDQLLVLGDITENKDLHPASLVNEVVGCFHDLSKLCEVIVLQGNHDFLNKENPFFQFIDRFENVSWISKPTVVLEQGSCLFLPHTRNYKEDWKNVDFGRHDYIFAHNIFQGVTANGHTLSGIPATIFPENARIISGDVHEPQTFGCITYVGAPFLCDFGDFYQPRLLLLDGGRRVSIKVGGPQKRLVTVNWPEKPVHEANPGDIVKIQANLKMEHVAKWAEIRNSLEDWGKQQQLVVNSIVPVVAYVKGEGTVAVKQESKTDNQYLDSYASRLGLDKETVKAGKVLVEELN